MSHVRGLRLAIWMGGGDGPDDGGVPGGVPVMGAAGVLPGDDRASDHALVHYLKPISENPSRKSALSSAPCSRCGGGGAPTPLDIATATTTALLAIAPAFGTQYLLWQTPSRTAYPTPLSMPLHIVLGAYAAVLYLPMSMLTWAHWAFVDKLMTVASLGVIALMIAAVPWAGGCGTHRRKGFLCRTAPLIRRGPSDPATAGWIKQAGNSAGRAHDRREGMDRRRAAVALLRGRSGNLPAGPGLHPGVARGLQVP